MKNTSESKRKRAPAADKRVSTLKTELAKATSLHSRLVEVGTRSKVDANKVGTDLQSLQTRLIKVEHEGNVSSGKSEYSLRTVCRIGSGRRESVTSTDRDVGSSSRS